MKRQFLTLVGLAILIVLLDLFYGWIYPDINPVSALLAGVTALAVLLMVAHVRQNPSHPPSSKWFVEPPVIEYKGIGTFTSGDVSFRSEFQICLGPRAE